MMKASIENQFYNEPCAVTNTEDMFWLRESDDYHSKIQLGNALAGQYRFREVIAAYNEALRIRNDDAMLYIRLGGAYLTLRTDLTQTLIKDYREDMKVGHHMAYQLAVSIFARKINIDSAFAFLEGETDELNYVIAAYGLCIYLASIGKISESTVLREKLLMRKSVWPCISYLAAWNDVS